MRLREPTERDPPVRIRALLPENISNSSPDVEEELGDIRGRWRAVRARTPAVFNLSFDEELVVKSTTSRTRCVKNINPRNKLSDVPCGYVICVREIRTRTLGNRKALPWKAYVCLFEPLESARHIEPY